MPLCFARIDEHGAETPHAFMKKELHHGPLAGAALLSLSQRMPLWHWIIEEDPEAVVRIAEHMQTVYNADRASVALGVSAHPDIAQLLQAQVAVLADGSLKQWVASGRQHAKVLEEIVPPWRGEPFHEFGICGAP